MRRRNVGAYRVARVLLPLLTVHVGSGVANAQSPALVTDRPDRSESAAVILKGMVQVETGYLFASNSNVSRYEAPGTLFRIGLGGQTELRIGPAGITGEEGKHGAGDGNLGVKVNLIERTNGWRPELAILGGLSLPTGDDGFSSDGVNPSFLVLLAYKLSPGLSLGSNVGVAWESSLGETDRNASVVYSFVLSSGLTDRWSAFLELFGGRQTAGTNKTSMSVDGGFTFLLTDLVQLDAYAGGGLLGPVDDVFVGTGLSFRVPR